MSYAISDIAVVSDLAHEKICKCLIDLRQPTHRNPLEFKSEPRVVDVAKDLRRQVVRQTIKDGLELVYVEVASSEQEPKLTKQAI